MSRKLKKFNSKIMGSSFVKGSQESMASLNVGDQLEVLREPTNEFDKNAIMVFVPNGGRIGYIKKEVAVDLAKDIDNGYSVNVTVADVTGGTDDKPNRGVNILIEVTDTEE